MIAASRPYGCSRSAATIASAASPATIRTAFPSLARYSGSKPRISHTPRTDSRTRRRPSSSTNRAFAADAISFSVTPTPPRVGSRMKRTFPANRGRSGRSMSERGATSESTGASIARFWRAISTATWWSPIVPVSRIRSPGRIPDGAGRQPSTDTPMPAVVMKIPSPFPRSTTFVSPQAMTTPASFAASRIAASARSRVSIGSPSSRIRAHEIATAFAPQTARSFTVPQTARRPMSPPGKKGGVTTYPSVVKAISPSIRPRSPASKNGESTGLSKYRAITFAIRSRVRLPPSPWESRILSCIAGLRRSVFEVGGAGAFAAYHARAVRLLRHARLPEEGAIDGGDLPLEHVPAAAGGHRRRVDHGVPELLLRVEGGVPVGDPQARPRDDADPAPPRVARDEDVADQILRLPVPGGGGHARILVLHAGDALLFLPQQHRDSHQDVERLEAGDHARDAVPPGDRPVGVRSDDDGDVGGAEEPFDADLGIGGQDPHRLRDRAHGRQDGEVPHALLRRRPDGAADGGGRRLEPHAEENDLPVRSGGGERHRVERRVHDADLQPRPLLLLEGGGFPRDPQHVAEGGEQGAPLRAQRDRGVDVPVGGDADRAAGPREHRHGARQQRPDPAARDRHGVGAANFHQADGGVPRVAPDPLDQRLGGRRVAEVVNVFHAAVHELRNSSESAISRNSASVRSASSSESLSMAKPAWTITHSPAETSSMSITEISRRTPPSSTTAAPSLVSRIFAGTPRHIFLPPCDLRGRVIRLPERDPAVVRRDLPVDER